MFPHGISFSASRHRLSRNRPNRSRFGGAPTRSFDTVRGHACGKEGSGWLEKAALSILSRQGIISPDRHNHPAFYNGSACGRRWAFEELFASFLYRLLRRAFFHCSKNGFVSNFSNNDIRLPILIITTRLYIRQIQFQHFFSFNTGKILIF